MNEPTFELYWSEEQRTELFRMMEKCGVLRIQLHALEEPTLEHWLEMTAPGRCDVWYAEGWGMCYLTQGFGLTPFAHFCIWPEARKDAKTFLYAACDHGFRMYSFNAVMGLTPKRYRHVFPLLKACGFEILGVIPDSILLRGKLADGVLSIHRRA